MEIAKQRNPVLGRTDRIVSIIGGGALVALAAGCYFGGRRRQAVSGTALAAAGTNFVVRGITGEGHIWDIAKLRMRSLPYGKGIKVKRAVVIDKPQEELYRFWRNFENLPKVLSHVESVTSLDENRSHWMVKAAGMKLEWDAEIITERPNEIIGWRSLAGAQVDNAGSVRFESAPGGRGTIVRVQLQYNPLGGRISSAIAKLFGDEPDQVLQTDLSRFKQLMETGEIATTQGQPSGRLKDRMERFERQYRPDEFQKPEPVQTGSELSFPASDPPSWMTASGSAEPTGR